MLKSLAGTVKADYIPVQLRIRSDEGTIHLQGKGRSVNRSYGVSADVAIEDNIELATYLSSRHALVPSLADTDKVYVPAQAAIRGKSVHLQFEGARANREYGAAFNIPAEDLPDMHTFIVGPGAEGTEVEEEPAEEETSGTSAEEEKEATFTGC